MIIINGTSLTVEQVAAVARTGEQVAISDEAKAAVNKARAYVEKKLDEKAVVYGLTTGFGKFSDKYTYRFLYTEGFLRAAFQFLRTTTPATASLTATPTASGT